MCHISCRTFHDGFPLFCFQSSSESEFRSAWYCVFVASSSARIDSLVGDAGDGVDSVGAVGSVGAAGSVSLMGVLLRCVLALVYTYPLRLTASPSIHSSPPSHTSFFQTGATSLKRSTSAWQASNAALQCGTETAAIVYCSPILICTIRTYMSM